MAGLRHIGEEGSLTHLPWRGVGFGLVAAFCLSAQDAGIKFLSDDYDILQIVFVRAAAGLLLASALLWRTGTSSALRPPRPGLAAARVAATVAANFCYYLALPALDLPVYTSIGLTVFLFATALSGPLLGEKPGIRDWLAVAAGLIGVAVIVNPFSSGRAVDLPAAALLLLGALMWAFAIAATRALGASMSSNGILFYTSAAVMLSAAAAQPLVWKTPSIADGALLLLIGVLGACGQGAAIAAYRNARMGAVIPTQHTMLLWAALYAWLIWDETPGTQLWIGALLIVGATLATLPGRR